jgi:hypothetical protein
LIKFKISLEAISKYHRLMVSVGWGLSLICVLAGKSKKTARFNALVSKI